MLVLTIDYKDVIELGEAGVLNRLVEYGFNVDKKYYVERSVFSMVYKFYQTVENSRILFRKFNWK